MCRLGGDCWCCCFQNVDDAVCEVHATILPLLTRGNMALVDLNCFRVPCRPQPEPHPKVLFVAAVVVFIVVQGFLLSLHLCFCCFLSPSSFFLRVSLIRLVSNNKRVLPQAGSSSKASEDVATVADLRNKSKVQILKQYEQHGACKQHTALVEATLHGL